MDKKFREVIITKEQKTYNNSNELDRQDKHQPNNKRNTHYSTKEWNDLPVISDRLEPIPLELMPTIKEAISYGKKTNVLGTLKALTIFENFVNELKPLTDNVIISDIIKRSEEQIHKFRNEIDQIYSTE